MMETGDEFELPEEGPRWLRKAVWPLVGVAAFGLIAVAVSSLMHGSKENRQAPTKISILPTTPPPPPPPPKEQPKPEPPKESQKTINAEVPKAQAQQPQDQQLKMEGEAGNGSSPFGSGKVTSDYAGGNVGNGVGRMQFALYTGQLQRFLQDELGRIAKLRSRDYRATVKVWLGRDGRIERFEIVSPSGTPEIDEVLQKSLGSLPTLHAAPPENMPQPIRVKISNRPLG